MNKKNLIDATGINPDVSRDTAGRTLGAFTSTITTEPAAGNDVALVGFSTFDE